MRYKVMCEGELGAGGWSIDAPEGPERYRIEHHSAVADHSFTLVGSRMGLATEARISRNWPYQHVDIRRAGELIARFRTSFRREIRASFVAEMEGPDRLEIRGDFHNLNYWFIRASRTVAVVSTLGSSDGSFTVEACQNEDQAYILASALSIRCLCGDPSPAPVVRILGPVAQASVARDVRARA